MRAGWGAVLKFFGMRCKIDRTKIPPLLALGAGGGGLNFKVYHGRSLAPPGRVQDLLGGSPHNGRGPGGGASRIFDSPSRGPTGGGGFERWACTTLVPRKPFSPQPRIHKWLYNNNILCVGSNRDPTAHAYRRTAAHFVPNGLLVSLKSVFDMVACLQWMGKSVELHCACIAHKPDGLADIISK